MSGPTASASRVAIVTGGARGIGASTVHLLARRGYNVVAVDWCVGEKSPVCYPQATTKDLDQVVAAAPQGRVIPVTADVRDREGIEAATEVALANWGRLDVSVAAAAVIAGGKPLWETPTSDLDLLWAVDVKGVWNTAAVTVPAMLSGPDPRGCRFVAVASAAASHGLFHLSAYNAAKHAVAGLIRGLAADLVGTGVTATAVSPGSTDTDMLQATARLYGVSVDDLAQHQLLRRVLDRDELAATIAFCCSREGGVLNGSIVNADGGFGR